LVILRITNNKRIEKGEEEEGLERGLELDVGVRTHSKAQRSNKNVKQASIKKNK
jgi:hypothetical protein